MDSSNVGPRKTPDQIPFWLDPKYDQYDFAYLFLHGLRYDRRHPRGVGPPRAAGLPEERSCSHAAFPERVVAWSGIQQRECRFHRTPGGQRLEGVRDFPQNPSRQGGQRVGKAADSRPLSTFYVGRSDGKAVASLQLPPPPMEVPTVIGIDADFGPVTEDLGTHDLVAPWLVSLHRQPTLAETMSLADAERCIAWCWIEAEDAGKTP